MKKINRVFVYGTLKRGFYFHEQYLGGDKANSCGPARTTKDYSLYTDGMPHMIKETSETGVKGELYEVDNKILKTLDDLEGHPIVYYRDIIEVIDEKGNQTLAWAYLRPIHFKGKISAFKEEEFT
jgi:gamma-glutamylcyclotransferase (GGCT)/AIG2-like uncharacterized protein YtfP